MPEPSIHDANDPAVAMVPVDGTSLLGQLAVPPSPIGLVLIPRLDHGGPPEAAYAAVALAFREKRFATVLVTLAPPSEGAGNEVTGWLRADIAQVADRIGAVVRSTARLPQAAGLPVALFAIDTVAAAALVAAGAPHAGIATIMAFNARTDLVDRALGKIAIPTLLIASSRATDVLTANRAALAELRCEKRLVIAPGNLKESLDGRAPRKLANLAARWFDRHIPKHPAAHGMR